MTQTQTISWTLGNGQQADVTVTLRTQRELIADHTMTRRCSEADVVAFADGVEVGRGEPVAIKHPTCVAAIGKLAMSADRRDAIMDAINNVLASDVEWIEAQARKAAEAADYYRHSDAMRKAMSY